MGFHLLDLQIIGFADASECGAPEGTMHSLDWLGLREFRSPGLADLGRNRCGGALDLGVDPAVGAGESIAKRSAWRPAQLFADQRIIGVATSDTLRAGNVADPDFLARDLHDHCGHAVDGYHLFRTNVHWSAECGRLHETANGLDALVDVEERARLLAVAPEFDFAATGLLGDFAAQCS